MVLIIAFIVTDMASKMVVIIRDTAIRDRAIRDMAST